MVARKASLQHKVLLGYMILIMAVCGMVSILLYERSRMREIKTETSEIRRIRHDISTAHRYITELATYGESVIVWEDTDFREYRRKRFYTDANGQLVTNIESELWHVRPAKADRLPMSFIGS